MDDLTLTKLSLIVALAGLAGIWAVSSMLEPAAMKIADIGSSDVGNIVNVEGSLYSVGQSGGNYFLSVDDGSRIKAVIFESSARNMPQASQLSKGDRVSVTGRVTLYKGELEIIVQALNVLSN